MGTIIGTEHGNDRQNDGMTGRILIADASVNDRITLRSHLSPAMHDMRMVTDGASALRIARADRPDLLLLDLSPPDLPAVEVLARLRADPVTRDVPVIATAARAAAATRLAALRAGADDVLAKPMEGGLLLARIRTLLRRHDMADSAFDGLAEAAEGYDWPGLVALTAFPQETATRLLRVLSCLPHRLALLDRAALLSPQPAVATPTPDAYLIDGAHDPAAAFAILSELRSGPVTRRAGIAVCASDPRRAALSYDLGADEVFLPDTDPAEIALRLDRLLHRSRAAATRNARLHDQARLAMTDPLTGLHNRRHALRRLGEISANAVGTGRGFTVLLADLDRFKRVNDRFGHPAGDAVLVEIATRLSAEMKKGDLLARIGGEEFLIALPGGRDGEACARALCAAVGDRPVLLPDGSRIHVTLSIGLATAKAGSLPDRVIDAADQALRAAKEQGRNRVIVARTAA